MATSNVEVVYVGVPGPPGAGITSGELSSIQGDISSLQSDMSTAQSDISTAQGDISALQGEVDDLAGVWLNWSFDGGGSAISVGAKQWVTIPYDCTITVHPVDNRFWQATIDPAGAISFDLWVDSYANFPPTSGDRICGTLGSQNPRVTATNARNSSSNTSGWTLALVGGQYLWVSVVSVTNATFANLAVYVVRS
ncbi:MAG: hypothetical protein KC438_06575 [Thermomicrobiales bacterium]|nr:hypothetical protein [Thermomicrobiales bacterium]